MSTAQEAPALIQYACERCKTRFVLPQSRRRLSLIGKIKATGMAVSRSIRYREGLHSTYDSSRRQLLAKLDDDAYQQFVQSFKFCHECRQFVCSECWSSARRTCLGCFAKAAGTTVKARPPFSPDGPEILRPAAAVAPMFAVKDAKAAKAAKDAKDARAATGAGKTRSRRLRTDAALLVFGIAILLFAVDLVFIYPHPSGASSPTASASDLIAGTSETPSPSPTEMATDTPSPSPTASPSATPSATPSESPTASPSPSATAAPTVRITPRITPRPTPRPPTPTPFPTPKIGCTPTSGPAATDTPISCSWNNAPGPGYTTSWHWSHGSAGSGYSKTFQFDGLSNVTIYLTANGKKSNSVTITVS